MEWEVNFLTDVFKFGCYYYVILAYKTVHLSQFVLDGGLKDRRDFLFVIEYVAIFLL